MELISKYLKQREKSQELKGGCLSFSPFSEETLESILHALEKVVIGVIGNHINYPMRGIEQGPENRINLSVSMKPTQLVEYVSFELADIDKSDIESEIERHASNN